MTHPLSIQTCSRANQLRGEWVRQSNFLKNSPNTTDPAHTEKALKDYNEHRATCPDCVAQMEIATKHMEKQK